MNNVIYSILDKINKLGYKSYIVGGYVRDLILNISNNDLDFVTNAPAEVLLDVFSAYKPVKLKNSTICFQVDNYNVDIAQMRREEYIDNKVSVTITDDLKFDYLRRDFTFNAIYMDIDGKFIEFDNNLLDCKNLNLKFIGDPLTRCKEDPSRILRAIYFILKYDLKTCSIISTINVNDLDFGKVDINLLNKVLIKILKLKKNEEFIRILNEHNLYSILFKNVVNITSSKPIDFLKSAGYIYIDTLI